MAISWNSSYVFGIDNESGWGERYFFTYYSEFGDRSVGIVGAETGIFAIIFVISIFANTAIVICVFRFPDMKTTTNCFVLNLAVADLVLTFSIPAIVYTRLVVSWKLGEIVCRFIPYSQLLSGIVLLWTLSLISMDRYCCIVVPPYRSKMTPTQTACLAGGTWVFIAIIFIPVTYLFRVQRTHTDKTICTLVFPKSESINYSFCFIVLLVLVACLLPIVMLVFYYQRIFHKIMLTRNTWAAPCVLVSITDIKGLERGQTRRQSEISITDILTPWSRKFSTNSEFSSLPYGRHGSLSQHEELRLTKHLKAIRMLFLNVVVVLIMWIPITTMMLLIFIDGKRPTNDTNFFLRSYHFIAALIVALLNTVMNPLLYGALSDNFRSCFLKMCCEQKIEHTLQVGTVAVTPS